MRRPWGWPFPGWSSWGRWPCLFPEGVAAHFGPAGTKYLWLMFIGLMAICLIMVLLILRPRLIIYNISVDQFRPILAEVVERMDPEARWAGDCLFLPGLGVQLHLESFRLDAKRIAGLFRPEAGLPGLVAAGASSWPRPCGASKCRGISRA